MSRKSKTPSTGPGTAADRSFDVAAAASNEPFAEYTLTAHDGTLVPDTQGRLAMNAAALAAVDAICAALDADHFGLHRLMGVFATNGSYQQDLVRHAPGAGEQFPLGGMDPVDGLLLHLRAQIDDLEKNAVAKRGKGAAALGITDDRLRLLVSLAKVQKIELKLTVRRNTDGTEFDVPLPTQELLDALVKPPKPDRPIEGKVTGIAIIDRGDIRVEVSHRFRAVVPGLTLEDGCNHLKAGAEVSGIAVDREGTDYLENARFHAAQPSMFP
jgi:hypothetical protein